MKFFIFFVSFFFAASLATPVPEKPTTTATDDHTQNKRDIITVETPNVVQKEIIVEEPFLNRKIVELERPIVEEKIVEIERPTLDRELINVQRPRLVDIERPLLEETIVDIERPLHERRIVDVERALLEKRIIDLERPLLDRNIINVERPLLDREILVEEPLYRDDLRTEVEFLPLRNREHLLRQNWNVFDNRVRSFAVQPTLGRRNLIDTEFIPLENRRVLVNVDRPLIVRRPQISSFEPLLEESLYRAPHLFPKVL